MLVIGHRGAAGLAPENSLEAMRAGRDVGADMLEFDVQLTRDKVLVVVHDSHLLRTHKKRKYVRWSTHESIQQAIDKGHQIATLEQVLDEFFGVILLNLELKGCGTAYYVLNLLKDRYVKKSDDWNNVLISSFRINELKTARKISSKAQLAMLHNRNPFTYIAWQRSLEFSAVGFNRLYKNRLATDIAKKAGIFTYVYTVNQPASMLRLAEEDIDGIVTDFPDRITNALKKRRS